MGMFDIVNCKYPLESPEELKDWNIDTKNIEFQTKDFENLMETYIIQENGDLWKKHEEYKWVDDDNAFLKGYMNVVSSEDKPHPYHGILEFYCYEDLEEKNGKHYVYSALYNAKFNDGKLVEMKSIDLKVEDVTEHKKRMDDFFQKEKEKRNRFINKYFLCTKPILFIRRKIVRLAYKWYTLNQYLYNCIVRWL